MANINVAVLAETDYVRKYMLKVCKKLKVSPLVLKRTVVDKWEQEEIERDLAELSSANIDVLLVESFANDYGAFLAEAGLIKNFIQPILFLPGTMGSTHIFPHHYPILQVARNDSASMKYPYPPVDDIARIIMNGPLFESWVALTITFRVVTAQANLADAERMLSHAAKKAAEALDSQCKYLDLLQKIAGREFAKPWGLPFGKKGV
jgi:hypothetical protein